MVADSSGGAGFHSFDDYIQYSKYTGYSRFLDAYKGKSLYNFLKWSGSPYESNNPLVKFLYTNWTLRVGNSSGSSDPNIQAADATLALLGNVGTGMMGLSAGVSEGPFYRGGDLIVRPQDLPINKSTGLVKAKRGLSVNIDPSKVEKFGEVSQVESIPEGWGFFQHGQDPGHFEIGSPVEIPPETYIDMIWQIVLISLKK